DVLCADDLLIDACTKRVKELLISEIINLDTHQINTLSILITCLPFDKTQTLNLLKSVWQLPIRTSREFLLTAQFCSACLQNLGEFSNLLLVDDSLSAPQDNMDIDSLGILHVSLLRLSNWMYN